eukprot:1148881-Pelagomonas_calceolata.AAC.9
MDTSPPAQSPTPGCSGRPLRCRPLAVAADEAASAPVVSVYNGGGASVMSFIPNVSYEVLCPWRTASPPHPPPTAAAAAAAAVAEPGLVPKSQDAAIWLRRLPWPPRLPAASAAAAAAAEEEEAGDTPPVDPFSFAALSLAALSKLRGLTPVLLLCGVGGPPVCVAAVAELEGASCMEASAGGSQWLLWQSWRGPPAWRPLLGRGAPPDAHTLHRGACKKSAQHHLMHSLVCLLQKFKFVKNFDRTVGRNKGGQERGQQEPIQDFPALHPLALSSVDAVDEVEESWSAHVPIQWPSGDLLEALKWILRAELRGGGG